jgi:hypothetical protein
MEKLVKYLFCFVLMASALIENCTLLAQSDLVLSGSNLKIVIDGGTKMVVDNLNFKNDANNTWWGGTGEMVFQGNTSATVSGTFPATYMNLKIDKPGTTLTLNTPVVVTQDLTMFAGYIATTSSNLLTIGTAPASPGSIVWTGGTVVGPLRRYFSGTASATQASGILPVGLSTVNRYAQVNYTGGLSTGGTITAEYKAGVCPIGYAGLPSVINGQMIQNYENEGYWEISPNGGDLNTATYSLILRGNALSTVTSFPDMSKLRLMKSVSHTTWDNTGLGAHSAPAGGTADFTISNSGMTGFSWFNIGSGNANPLPVTMLNFAANCNEKSQVDVKWTTASEQNSQSFVVERSRDLSQWEYVTSINAAGNSNYNINYATADDSPISGTSYYRLIQIDLNGSEVIYGPISVSCAEESSEMIVFPSPNNGNFTVEITTDENLNESELVIIDLAGKIVSKRNINVLQGKTQAIFQNQELQVGTYIIQLNSSNHNIQPVKVVVN